MPATRTKAFKGSVRRSNRRCGARMLGIRTHNNLAVVRQIQAGLSFSRLIRFGKTSGLPLERIAQFAAIPQRTLSRRRGRGRLRPDESDRLLRVCRVFEMAVELFEGDVATARDWLQKPQPGLGGAIPFTIASTDVGVREVEDLIGRLEYGVFS